MKKLLSILTLIGVTTIASLTGNRTVKVDASTYTSLPSEINLAGVAETDIRGYYSNLNSLATTERQGTNLLKNLKPILRNNFTYISYDNVWKAYEITDRDWNLSPASEIKAGTYNSSKNSISGYTYKSDDPYIHCYYRDQSSDDRKVTAWEDHTAKGINREHIWPQSHGFKETDGGASGPAGTDLHHLVAADGFVNQSVHNNYPYGNVNVVDTVGNRTSTTNNKVGAPKTTSSSDLANKVFEPQDQDKGDIARACFYMVAMYNNFAGASGAISEFDPNLQLVAYVTEGDASESSSDTVAVNYGNLKDLLEWNKLDPVDEYEMHRNDIIYNNYEHNRNPFIDFPQWADLIWGDESTSKYASPETDELNKSKEYTPPKDNSSNSLPLPVIIGASVAVVVIVIVFVIIYANSSKKNQKKMIKGAKKVIKSSSSRKRK